MGLFINFLWFFCLAGCAQKNIQKISENAQINRVHASSGVDLQEFINELITSSRFSTKQKNQLNELQAELNEKLQINADMNIKLRALLFKELLSSFYSHDEVEMIALMLERNHIEKNSLLLDAARITNIITKRAEHADENNELRPEVNLLY